jgi:hypothetical protein
MLTEPRVPASCAVFAYEPASLVRPRRSQPQPIVDLILRVTDTLYCSARRGADTIKALSALEAQVQACLEQSLIELVKTRVPRSMAAPAASTCTLRTRASAAKPCSASIC